MFLPFRCERGAYNKQTCSPLPEHQRGAQQPWPTRRFRSSFLALAFARKFYLLLNEWFPFTENDDLWMSLLFVIREHIRLGLRMDRTFDTVPRKYMNCMLLQNKPFQFVQFCSRWNMAGVRHKLRVSQVALGLATTRHLHIHQMTIVYVHHQQFNGHGCDIRNESSQW